MFPFLYVFEFKQVENTGYTVLVELYWLVRLLYTEGFDRMKVLVLIHRLLLLRNAKNACSFSFASGYSAP